MTHSDALIIAGMFGVYLAILTYAIFGRDRGHGPR